MKYLQIVRILLLLMVPLSIHANGSINCAQVSVNDLNMIKEKAIKTLVQSNVFKEFTKKYSKETKFAFPLEMAKVQDCQKCIVEITVYIDEGDHYSLIGNFLLKDRASITLLQSI